MRTTMALIILSLLLAFNANAADTFEMALPDESQPAGGSGGFVESFQYDLGSSGSQRNTSSRAPASVAVDDEPQGAYESAFTSIRSKKSSSGDDVDQADDWRAKQDKPDTFDIESLSYSAPEPAYSAPVKSQTLVKAKSQHSQREPASVVDEIPMPDSDSGSEFQASPAPSSAKERKALVLQTISQNYGELKSCYREGLRQNSNMKGKVVMGWAMDDQGRVSSAEVQTSQLKNKNVEKCMVDRMSNWRFPRQAKVQGSKDRMTYTFQFVPE